MFGEGRENPMAASPEMHRPVLQHLDRQRRDDERDAMCGSAPRPSHSEGGMLQHRGVERGTAPHPLPLPEQEFN